MLRRTELVPPGDYRLTVSGGGPNRYDLSIELQPGALPPDQFDRGLVRNNAFVTAAEILRGGFDLTLHTASDRDYFRISPPAGMSRPLVTVQSELPVTIELLDAASRAVIDSHAEITVGGFFPAPSRDHVIRVTGSAQTRYTLSFTNFREPRVPYLVRNLKPFDPGDPPPFLHGPWQVWPIADQSKLGRIVAESPEVRLSLVQPDKVGPVRVSRTDAAGAQVLDLTGLPTRPDYMLMAQYSAKRQAVWHPHELTKLRLRVEPR
jgi:hypothetical protein